MAPTGLRSLGQKEPSHSRILIAALVVVGAALTISTPSQAAPVPLTGTSSHKLAKDGEFGGRGGGQTIAGNLAALRAQVGWRCKRYYRPYPYRYWQFYYPYGAPLSYSRR
jgi:hypothetical protein